MASNIDATIPVAGSLIQAGPLQLNFWTIKQEIEALQAAITTPCTCNVTVGSVAPFPATTGALWFDTVSAQLYVYDGCQWIVAVHVGDGVTVAPDWGVTDGSLAGPGQVGEVVAVPFGSGTLVIAGGASGPGDVLGNPYNICQMTLSPGDWDVNGAAIMNGQAGGFVGFLSTWLNIDPIADARSTMGFTPQWEWGTQSVVRIQYNISYPSVVTLQYHIDTVGSLSDVGKIANIQGRLQARRMR